MAVLGNTKAISLTLLDGVIGNLNPKVTTTYDLGTSSLKWNNIYGTLKGNADTATKWAAAQTVYVTLGTASTTTTIQGGSSSAQTIGVNGTLGIGNGGTGKTSWDINKITYASAANTLGQLAHASSTSYLLKSGSASTAPSWIQYTNANTASTIVQRDASGNFSAGTITATLSGNASSATEFSATTTVDLTGDATGTSAASKKGWSVPVTLANSGVTAGSYGPSANAEPGYGTTFDVPYITVDAKGRVTSASTKTVKIPASDEQDHRDEGYGKIAIGTASTATIGITANTNTINARTYNEKFTINPGNKWIALAATDNTTTNNSDTITIAHSVPSSITNSGPSTQQTPGFNATFNIPVVALDAAGHVTGISTTTVKIPAQTNLSGGSAATADATVVGGVTVSNHAVTVAKKTMTASTGITIAGAADKVTFSVNASDLYWANENVKTSASYKTTPEVAKLTVNGKTASGDTDAASTKNVQLVYDTSLEVLNFVFS